ncbi:hypothetical protein TIFTF001_038729 [Ficus carica]|uniref:Uncharacterized protein n=1 Tax=Ficus carica TaxID=3494 RepID=A0AA88EB19_FICCA|nr:hypothetical protein TIFTF001_038729 [Ficus carica]
MSSKRSPLKKADKVHYIIAGFPLTLLVWAYESIPTIAGKFTTKHVEANPRMLSWTSADNMKFDAVMSTLTVVGEKQSNPASTMMCHAIMITDQFITGNNRKTSIYSLAPTVGLLAILHRKLVQQPWQQNMNTMTNFPREAQSINKKLQHLKRSPKSPI